MPRKFVSTGHLCQCSKWLRCKSSNWRMDKARSEWPFKLKMINYCISNDHAKVYNLYYIREVQEKAQKKSKGVKY